MLHKPLTAHTLRSSFYMVAKGVQPGCGAAVRAVEGWKGMWKAATLKVGEVDVGAAGGGMEDKGDILFQKMEGELERAEAVLEEFGKECSRRKRMRRGMRLGRRKRPGEGRKGTT